MLLPLCSPGVLDCALEHGMLHLGAQVWFVWWQHLSLRYACVSVVLLDKK